MLFVVTSGLLVVKNGTLGDASMLDVQFPRFGSYRRQRDALLVLAECIDTLFHQINSPLAELCIDLLL